DIAAGARLITHVALPAQQAVSLNPSFDGFPTSPARRFPFGQLLPPGTLCRNFVHPLISQFRRKGQMRKSSAVIHVVDDDSSFRSAIGELLSACGYEVSLHKTATEFLACPLSSGPACLLLDLQMD
ncbi:MAG: hypothetical protein WCC43_00150, partial [Pseudolabrys sp.]